MGFYGLILKVSRLARLEKPFNHCRGISLEALSLRLYSGSPCVTSSLCYQLAGWLLRSVENIHKFIVQTDTWRIRASSLRNEMQKCTLICNKTLCFSRPHSRRPHIYIKLQQLEVTCFKSMHICDQICMCFHRIFTMVQRHA